MTIHALNAPSPSVRFRDTHDLIEALGLRFSSQQLEAITAPLEPGVIIAGAGSGKTTVMAARVVWLVGTGAVRPEQVLGLTFTRKAAAELSARVRIALQSAGVVGAGVDESGEQLIMTYDAFAARVVSEHGLRLGYEADPSMISGATRYRLASRVVKAAAGPFEYLSRLRPATVTERVLKLDADLQQHLVDSRQLDPHARELLIGLESAPTNNRGNTYADIKRAILAAQERLELASLVRDYQLLKRRLGLVEFADQMAVAARLATEVPHVSTALRGAFRVVLLDEYQDTSAAQARMLHGLFSGTTPSEGLGHPVTAVGDPFQAIYGWRGAAASNITSFAADFRSADGAQGRRFALTVNRRSGAEILDVANVLSAPLRTAGVVEPGLGLLEPTPEAGPGRVQAATFDTWPAEIEWICDQIVEVHRTGAAPHWADIAVLTRRNADIAALYGSLTDRDVPVEIVGLGGLLHLPEVMDVTATLRLVDDVTANPDLIRLLTGPRWQIGPRDLALLGRRARQLAQDPGAHRHRSHAPAQPAPEVATGIHQALENAVAEVDPTDVVSVLDAVENPGDQPFSTAARERFADISTELAYLRGHSAEPVLDLTRRVISAMGLDVELLATPDFVRGSRRDQLGAFLDAVAAYVDVDGDASLAGLLAYLQAEIDQGSGLEQSVPSDREAVKLLTVHKAKGLEWEVVFLPALMKGVFPSDRVTDNWVTNPAVLPAELRGDAGSIPQLADTSNDALADFKRALTREQLLAEDRLAYVAATRAKSLLIGTGHVWRADLIRPRISSTYLNAIIDRAREQGELLAEAGSPVAVNPLVGEAAPVPWPQPLDPDALSRRTEAAEAVEQARKRSRESGVYDSPDALALLLDGEEVVAGWDADLDRLLHEARQVRSGVIEVRLPAQLSTTAVLALQENPEAYVASLARPMPRPPSRSARFGTRFHQWIEQYLGAGRVGGGFGQQQLVDPDELSDRADYAHPEASEVRELAEAFTAGQFGVAVPYALEAPVTLAIGGRLIRGRIDAVYEKTEVDHGFRFQVIDWKTGSAEDADPWQLGIYRLAWAEACEIPVEQVDAAFYFIRSNRLVRPRRWPDRGELERLLGRQ